MATWTAGVFPIQNVHTEARLHGFLRRPAHYVVAEQPLFDAALYDLARVQRDQRLAQNNLRHSKIGLLLTFDIIVVMIVHWNRLLFLTLHP